MYMIILSFSKHRLCFNSSMFKRLSLQRHLSATKLWTNQIAFMGFKISLTFYAQWSSPRQFRLFPVLSLQYIKYVKLLWNTSIIDGNGTNLPHVIEVTMWHLSLTRWLVEFIQQRVQFVLWWQIIQSTKTERLSAHSRTKQNNHSSIKTQPFYTQTTDYSNVPHLTVMQWQSVQKYSNQTVLSTE